MEKPKIYLAGKITFNDWRNKIENNETRETIFDKEEYFNSEYESYEYIITGPHAIACDHGCYHNNPHTAVGVGIDLYDCNGLELTKGDVSRACKSQIDKSDMIFAYIDSVDAYGTFAEIGYAVGKGIPVFILVKEDTLKRDLWFILEMADYCFYESDFNRADRAIDSAFHKAKNLLWEEKN